jgi:hypothetical protein
MLPIKLSYNQEVRRIAVPVAVQGSKFTFQSLQSTAQSLFPLLKGKPLVFQWCDDENDVVSCSTDSEVEEALRVMRSENKTTFTFEIAVQASAVHDAAAAEPVATGFPSSDEVHEHVRCDGCGMCPIIGARFKCTVREDFDLCEACEAATEQPYPMIKIYDADHKPDIIMVAIRDESENPRRHGGGRRCGGRRRGRCQEEGAPAGGEGAPAPEGEFWHRHRGRHPFGRFHGPGRPERTGEEPAGAPPGAHPHFPPGHPHPHFQRRHGPFGGRFGGPFGGAFGGPLGGPFGCPFGPRGGPFGRGPCPPPPVSGSAPVPPAAGSIPSPCGPGGFGGPECAFFQSLLNPEALQPIVEAYREDAEAVIAHLKSTNHPMAPCAEAVYNTLNERFPRANSGTAGDASNTSNQSSTSASSASSAPEPDFGQRHLSEEEELEIQMVEAAIRDSSFDDIDSALIAATADPAPVEATPESTLAVSGVPDDAIIGDIDEPTWEDAAVNVSSDSPVVVNTEPAAAAVTAQESKWARELFALREMGFTDLSVLVPLLSTHCPDPESMTAQTRIECLQHVVMSLLSQSGALNGF